VDGRRLIRIGHTFTKLRPEQQRAWLERALAARDPLVVFDADFYDWLEPEFEPISLTLPVVASL